jgi:hypothetical protein
VDASLPFIHQLNLLVQPSELRGLTADLSVTVPALAKLTVETIPFMKNQVRPASSCASNEIIPWSRLTLHDSHFNAKNGFPPRPVYVEGVDFLPGLAGESRDFDANGMYIRILGALGNTVTQSLQPGLVGGALQPTEGEEPRLPPKIPPPLQPNTPCETQPAITTVSDAETGPKPTPMAAPDKLSPKQQKVAQQARTSLLTSLQKGLAKEGISMKVPGQPTSNTSNTSAKK